MWPNLFVELTGSFVGAALGLLIAIQYDHSKERRNDARRKSEAIKALIGEITRTLMATDIDVFEAPERVDPNAKVAVAFSRVYLLDAAFKATVSSGTLALMPAELQLDLAAYYRELEMTNHLVNRFVSLQSELDHSNMWLYRNMSNHIKGFISALDQLGQPLLEKLRQELPPARKKA